MRFHLLGLVHLPVSERYMGCAFTQKIVKMSKMLLDLGHEVYLYGSEGSDAPCTKFIQTHTLNDIRDEWGEGDNRFEIGYDWKSEGFRHDFNDEKTKTTKKYYENCIKEINKRKKENDFLIITQGMYQRPIGNAVNLFLTIEPGVGYRGSYCRFRAFESAYLQNFTYGSEHPKQSINGNFYDRVIPNYYDKKDFEWSDKKDDYFLYIGRLITRKGIDIAIKTCDYLDAKLKIAGQGEYKTNSKNVEFVGYVEPKERNKLMMHAKAVFVPTLYLEAFGGVHIEAMLSGTPVITTNFGVFPETIINEVNGFRCNTLEDFVNAAIKSTLCCPDQIRKMGERYLMENVKEEYQKWFVELYRLYKSTIDPTKKAWHFVK